MSDFKWENYLNYLILAKLLNEIGIFNKEQLEEIGSKETWLKIK
ncbi:MAG: TfoX/Sxy family protein [Methanobacteriaceae archaeon]|jgi:hypothetical protein|nr:TfoX/Sxy family protein [Methanobacteriaceae archaeon]